MVTYSGSVAVIKVSSFVNSRDQQCGGGFEYLHRDPASRRRRRKGKSQIWNSQIRSRVPRSSDPRKTTLARASSIYNGARHQDLLIDWPSVAMWLWLWLLLEFKRSVRDSLQIRQTDVVQKVFNVRALIRCANKPDHQIQNPLLLVTQNPYKWQYYFLTVQFLLLFCLKPSELNDIFNYASKQFRWFSHWKIMGSPYSWAYTVNHDEQDSREQTIGKDLSKLNREEEQCEIADKRHLNK
jgi:hypothetical protein